MTDNEIIKNLVLDLVKTSYPLGRIKDKSKFRKGICIDGQNFYLPKDKVAIIGKMFNNLSLIYDITPEMFSQIIENEYKFKV